MFSKLIIVFIAIVCSVVPNFAQNLRDLLKEDNLASDDIVLIEAKVISDVSGIHPNEEEIRNSLTGCLISFNGVIEKVIPNLSIATVNISGEKLDQVLDHLYKDTTIVSATPNIQMESLYVPITQPPSDPRYPSQWGIKKIDLPRAWDLIRSDRRTCTPVTVGVIDSGVDVRHPDLARNMWRHPDLGIFGWNFIDRNQDPSNDWARHGTPVAGTIAAVADNSVGMVGVAGSARIMALRTRYRFDEQVDAIGFAMVNGAKIINASYGSILKKDCTGGVGSQTVFEMFKKAGAAGILITAAAGNDGCNNDRFGVYPTNYPLDNIISVGASDPDDQYVSTPKWRWASNWGVNNVDLAAPGEVLNSTLPGGSYTTRWNGTSAAAPHVAGVAALLLGVYPDLSMLTVKEAILNGVDKIQGFESRVKTGGRLNAAGALEQIRRTRPTLVLSNDDTGSNFGRSIALNGNRLLVGAPVADPNSEGRVYLYDTTSGRLLHTFSNGDTSSEFGFSVAWVGNRILIGAPVADPRTEGRVYLYSSTTPYRLLHTYSNGDTGSRFGHALTAVGNRVLIGSPEADPNREGRVYLYSITAPYSNLHTFSNGDTASQFGAALAAAGNKIVIGAPEADPNVEGRVYLYSSFSPYRLLHTYSNGDTGSRFGRAVAASGSRVLIGAPIADPRTEGRVYLYSTNAPYRRLHTFRNDDSSSEFGHSVQFVDDNLFIGSRYAEEVGNVKGAAYIFDGNTFKHVFPLRGVDHLGEFGTALAGSNNRFFVGAPFEGGKEGKVLQYRFKNLQLTTENRPYLFSYYEGTYGDTLVLWGDNFGTAEEGGNVLVNGRALSKSECIFWSNNRIMLETAATRGSAANRIQIETDKGQSEQLRVVLTEGGLNQLELDQEPVDGELAASSTQTYALRIDSEQQITLKLRPTFWAWLSLFDGNNNRIGSRKFVSRGSTGEVIFSLAAGEYTVEIAPVIPNINGPYTLAAEINDSARLAIDGPILADEVVDRSVKFQLAVASRRLVTITLKPEFWAWLNIFDKNNNRIGSRKFVSRGATGNVTVRFEPGNYTVEVSPVNIRFNGPFTLRAIEGSAKMLASENIPQTPGLDANYPNPFNSTTTIRYRLAEPGPVQLTIYNLNGQAVKSLVNTTQNPGFYALPWDGKNNNGASVSSGIYLVELKTEQFAESRKISFLK